MNMALDINANRDAINTCQEDFQDIVIYGPAWIIRHPWSDRLLSELMDYGWQTVRDSTGSIHALMHLSMCEGEA